MVLKVFKDIFVLFLGCAGLMTLVHNDNSLQFKTNRGNVNPLAFDSGFYSPLWPEPMPTPKVKKKKPGKKNKNIQTHFRNFVWKDHMKKERQTNFYISEPTLKKENRRFGTTRTSSKHPFFLKKRGFEVITRQNFVRNSRLQQGMVTVVDYKQLFDRHLEYFPELTRSLMESAEIPERQDPLKPMLSFVQHIPYKLPPNQYKGRFINSFFIPLVVLYEQYGDCDSKSLLLAEFLCTVPGAKENGKWKEKTGMILIRGNGLAHAVLAVKRTPLPGMTSLHDMKRGYYILVETTRPGWTPGFISRRVTETIKAGYFRFVQLN